MKRIICIILALMMCLTLISCGGEPVEEETPSTPDAAEDPVTDIEMENGNTDNTESDVGTVEYIQPNEYFYDPDFDYTQNPKLRICLFAFDELSVTQIFDKAISQWCSIMNIEYGGVFLGGFDEEKYYSALEKAAADNDGIIMLNFRDINRCLEITEEQGCRLMTVFETRDYENLETPLMQPAVVYDYEKIGTLAAEFLVNYAKEKFGNIDNIGWLYVEYSSVSGAEVRRSAFLDKLFDIASAPNLGSRYNYIDAGSTVYDGDLYWNIEKLAEWYPDIEHWICFAADGASAQEVEFAVTDLGITDRFSVLSAGLDEELIKSWDNGESAHRIGIIDTSVMLHTEALVCGIYSMIAGDMAPEDLWEEWTDENEPEYAKRMLPVHLYTSENYKQYLEWTDTYWSAENYNYDSVSSRDEFVNTVDIPESYELEIVVGFNTYSQEYVDSCEILPDEIVNYHPERHRYRSIRDLSFYAPDIIRGKITEVAYTNDDINPHYIDVNYPYTVYTIEITEGIRGELKAGDKIVVLEEGGYVHWEKYNFFLDYKSFDEERPYLTEGQIGQNFYENAPPVMEVGTELLLFLHKSWMDCYEILGSWTGCYYIENGEVWRYIDNTEKFVFGTFEEAVSEIEEYPFDIEEYVKRYGYYD